MEVVLKHFDSPDVVREMPHGRFEIVRISDRWLGRATYQPGWRWSQHVGPSIDEEWCTIEHLGLVISGTATVALPDGKVTYLRPGELFYIPGAPHDSWVVGDEPYVSIHLTGAERYAATAED